MVERMPIAAGMWGSYDRRKGLNRATAFKESTCGSFERYCLSEEVLCSYMPIGDA